MCGKSAELLSVRLRYPNSKRFHKKGIFYLEEVSEVMIQVLKRILSNAIPNYPIVMCTVAKDRQIFLNFLLKNIPQQMLAQRLWLAPGQLDLCGLNCHLKIGRNKMSYKT